MRDRHHCTSVCFFFYMLPIVEQTPGKPAFYSNGLGPKSVYEGTHHLARPTWSAAAAPTRKGVSMDLLLLISQRANQSVSARVSSKLAQKRGSDVAKLHSNAGWNKHPRFCLCFKRRARDLKLSLLLDSTGCRRSITLAFTESLAELLIQLRKSHLA